MNEEFNKKIGAKTKKHNYLTPKVYYFRIRIAAQLFLSRLYYTFFGNVKCFFSF